MKYRKLKTNKKIKNIIKPKKNKLTGGADVVKPSHLKKKKILTTGLVSYDLDLDLDLDEITDDTHPFKDVRTGLNQFLSGTQFKYFGEETGVNPGIITEMERITYQEMNELVVDDLQKIVDNPNKEIVSINLHGTLIKERMRFRLPHNVILCQLSTINTLNFIMKDKNFNFENFLAKKMTPSQFQDLFRGRTLYSTPENFKTLNEDVKLGAFNINFMIECLKKAQWYFPHQLYYDIELLSSDTETMINKYSVVKKKIMRQQKLFREGEKTTLQEEIRLLSLKEPDKVFLVFNNSCQSFQYERDKIEEESKILNSLFIHTAIMYEVNLTIDSKILKPVRRLKEMVSKGVVLFCQDQNYRTASIFDPQQFDSNYYIHTPQNTKKTDNLNRKFPFFLHIQNEMETKKLNKKDIQRFAVFFLGLSLNKKIKFYYKLLDILSPEPDSIGFKNFQNLMKKVSEDKYFILTQIKLLENLNTKKMFWYQTNPYPSQRDIVDLDVKNFLHLLNLIFTVRGLEQQYYEMINKTLSKTFLDKYHKTTQFFFTETTNLKTGVPDNNIKELVLYQTLLDEEILRLINSKYPLLEGIKFSKLTTKGRTPITYNIHTKIRTVDVRDIDKSQDFHIKIFRIPGAYQNLTFLYLEDCNIEDNLMLYGIPIQKLYLLRVRNLSNLYLRRLDKLEELDIHLLEPCAISLEQIKVDKFNFDCDITLIDFIDWIFFNFEVNRINVSQPFIFYEYLNNNIQLHKPLLDITYTGLIDKIPFPIPDLAAASNSSPFTRLIVEGSSKCISPFTTLTIDRELNMEYLKLNEIDLQNSKNIKELKFLP